MSDISPAVNSCIVTDTPIKEVKKVDYNDGGHHLQLYL